MNLVLDDVNETLRGKSNFFELRLLPLSLFSIIYSVLKLLSDDDGNETTRPLGLVVARGTLLVLISPLDGSEQIENPFTQSEE